VAHGAQPVGTVLEDREIAPRDRLADVQADPPVLVELVDLEQPELLERAAVQALTLRATVGSGVGEAVVEPLVADRRPEQRLVLQEPVPIAFELPVRRGAVVSHRPFAP
jgi:hypothetical protein